MLVQAAGFAVLADSRWRPRAGLPTFLPADPGRNYRFRTGPVQLREDTERRSRLHRFDRAAVTTVCSPLMAHYGYRLAR